MNERLMAVARMQDYISVHLYEEITLADLAAVSFYSPWHSYRIFRERLGLTPSDYIRRLRLSRSAMRLKNEGVSVTKAAFECGFGSVDGYQRAFLREFGCNPGEYSRKPVPIALFIPYSARPREEIIEMEVKSVFIKSVEKPERKVIIKRGVKADEYFAYCGEVGCDVWGILASMDSLCGEPVCLWLPERYVLPNTSVYVQGVEVAPDYDGVIPEGFDVITLPAAEYLSFKGEPFREENYEEAIVQVRKAIEKFNPTDEGYAWDEENPRIQLEPRGERGYIELLPVKKV